MPLRRWKRLAQSTVYANPWWTYRRDDVELPSGRRGEYHYVHTNGSSMVVPVRDDGRILLVNQFRYLVGKESVEFPCGSVKDGHTYEQTAWQELAEETGHSAGTLLQVGEYNPYNGVTDEMCRVYVARGLREVGPAPDDTEEFELVAMLPAEIDAAIRDGSIWDGMSIVAWTVAQQVATCGMP